MICNYTHIKTSGAEIEYLPYGFSSFASYSSSSSTVLFMTTSLSSLSMTPSELENCNTH